MIESWKELFLFGPEIVISQRVPNGGGGVSQLSLFDVKSEKRRKSAVKTLQGLSERMAKVKHFLRALNFKKSLFSQLSLVDN